MIIAAAGGHNLLMIGPPGCGKSMLAQCFPGLLPPLYDEELLEVVKIHSSCGMPVKSLLNGQRPFRSPHHVISDVGLIGGGTNPRPGEISLAHHGVLFLDEFPEFRRTALEGMRAPLETGQVSIVRARGAFDYPAQFQLIAAMNPCPCGRLGVKDSRCNCSAASIQSYLKKLSQPILDRIDMHVELQAVPLESIGSSSRDSDEVEAAQTDQIISEIAIARDLQFHRQKALNATLDGKGILGSQSVDPKALNLLERSANRIGFSARTFVRLLRVGRTIADLDGESIIRTQHIAEAISLRSLERISNLVQAA
jgi:magnesium chelatase family protein